MVNLRDLSTFSYPLTTVEWIGLTVNLLVILTEPQSLVPNSMSTYIVFYYLKSSMIYEFEFCSIVWQINYLNQAKDFKNVSPYFV
jgi:hypothetical protein